MLRGAAAVGRVVMSVTGPMQFVPGLVLRPSVSLQAHSVDGCLGACVRQYHCRAVAHLTTPRRANGKIKRPSLTRFVVVASVAPTREHESRAHDPMARFAGRVKLSLAFACGSILHRPHLDTAQFGRNALTSVAVCVLAHPKVPWSKATSCYENLVRV